MDLAQKIKQAKLDLLEMHYNAKVGHVGGNFSCIDILMTLHHEIMGPDDQFILSKGHSAGALYVTLASLGIIPKAELLTFHKDATRLPGHPAPNTFVPFATGSLGHGLSLAAGLALGKKLQGQPGRVYCVLSDGELQEGSTQEALMFAHTHNLPLTAIVDGNGWQGFGRNQEIMGGTPEKILQDIYKGWCIGGHDMDALMRICKDERVRDRGLSPRLVVIFGYTRKGHHIPGLTDTMESHYKPLTGEQYLGARAAIEAL